MKKTRNRTKLNIPMCAACVLLCLTLLSIHLSAGLYAKYTTSAEGRDSARVITFGEISITEEGDFGDDGNLTGLIVPGVDLTKKAMVSFSGSEAATYVFAEVVVSENWTHVEDSDTFHISSGNIAYLQWQIADGWTYLMAESGANNEKRYIYYRELAPNVTLDKTDIVGNGGVITVSSQIPIILQNGLNELDDTYIKFQARVVQSSGFADAAAAWNSVKRK